MSTTKAEKREQKKRKQRKMKVSGASVKKLRKIQLGGVDALGGLDASRSRAADKGY